MSITTYLFTALTAYGLPVLFGIALIASVGLPLPTSLFLIAAGAFAEQGDLNFTWAIVLASSGAIIGDNIGYGIGRWGGRALVARVSGWFGGKPRLADAAAGAQRWGGAVIFLSRWLLTPLGSWVNLTSGMTAYPWPRFLLWDALGEVLWVILSVTFGWMFSDRVQALSAMLGDLTWAAVGVVAALVLGWRLIKSFRVARTAEGDPATTVRSDEVVCQQ
jgi:membrane protein DedA with SNARE-associated domain